MNLSQQPSLRTVELGSWVIERGHALAARVDYLGETVIGVGRLLRGRTHPDQRFAEAFREAGEQTLPVVALFAVASGLVLTLLTTQQLERVGVPGIAPRLVSIVILRELGSLMTGIALAGRVASGFTAEIASAVVAGDAAATRASGASPVEVLVAPRVLALALSGPLLVAWANTLALLGAAAMGGSLTEMMPRAHLEATLSALTADHALTGLLKGAAFGVVVGVVAGWHGLRGPAELSGVAHKVRRAVVYSVASVAMVDLGLTLVFKWVDL